MGADNLPSAERTRRRPGLSVISILPPGRNATDHGFCSPSRTVTTSNATPDFFSGASVCPPAAGFCSGLLAGRGSTGAWPRAKLGKVTAMMAAPTYDEILIHAILHK